MLCLFSSDMYRDLHSGSRGGSIRWCRRVRTSVHKSLTLWICHWISEFLNFWLIWILTDSFWNVWLRSILKFHETVWNIPWRKCRYKWFISLLIIFKVTTCRGNFLYLLSLTHRERHQTICVMAHGDLIVCHDNLCHDSWRFNSPMYSPCRPLLNTKTWIISVR